MQVRWPCWVAVIWAISGAARRSLCPPPKHVEVQAHGGGSGRREPTLLRTRLRRVRIVPAHDELRSETEAGRECPGEAAAEARAGVVTARTFVVRPIQAVEDPRLSVLVPKT